MSKKYRSTKTYGHEQGLSCCFRQWRATHSHCSLLHGYAISVALEFEADELDQRNWVVDFGALGEVKEFLQYSFDHTLMVAQDDPELDTLTGLNGLGLARCIVLPRVGCEAFAEYIADFVQGWLQREGLAPRVDLAKVEVREHGANSAIYYPQ
ncbi:hypothetical protein [Pseudomonas virus PBPA162]|uniref:6-carboxy-5,6,7,8-tetrahydropterin synthase n=1 Tax=Pseudomonas virus PBPA162 TaxID=2588096 RepID=A0A4Y5TNC6_9CAUD|nr:hypothetical protein PQC32_gp10 [Pseudomonas virus PBPA162]QDB70844.1 hypothetical protein [Pseudomonas virus PBPA162]